MLFPSRCPTCRAVGPAPCAGCRARLQPAPALPAPSGVDRLFALFAYDGVGREVVARLKYRNARSSLAWLAAELVNLLAVATAATTIPPVDFVTWIPTTVARRHERGFDQAELLARRVARRARLPPSGSLMHTGSHQTGRSAFERRAGPAIAARGSLSGRPHVVVIDDVVTTGATMTAAARALRAAGAGAVTGLAVARTPLKGR